jgi:hypothetical protein
MPWTTHGHNIARISEDLQGILFEFDFSVCCGLLSIDLLLSIYQPKHQTSSRTLTSTNQPDILLKKELS